MGDVWAGGGVKTGRARSPLQEELAEVSTLGAYFEMLRQVVTESGTRVGEVGNSTRLQVKNQSTHRWFIRCPPLHTHTHNRRKYLTRSIGG